MNSDVATIPVDIQAAPAALNEIGQRFADGHDRAQRGSQEWVEGSLEMAAALAEGREQLKSDIAFGAWLAQHGHNLYGKDDRAALINLGRDITLARKVLETTQSRSYRLIWSEAADRFRSAAKPPVAGKRIKAKTAASSTKAAAAPISSTEALDPYAPETLQALPAEIRARVLAALNISPADVPVAAQREIAKHAVEQQKRLDDREARDDLFVQFHADVKAAAATGEAAVHKLARILSLLEILDARTVRTPLHWSRRMTPESHIRFGNDEPAPGEALDCTSTQH